MKVLAAEGVNPRYPHIEAFYAECEARRRSPEVDFGVLWQYGGWRWPLYRVSWVEATGEFYAIRQGGDASNLPGEIELLGTVEGRERAEAALAGWAEQEPMRLAWARARIAAASGPRPLVMGPAEAVMLEGDEDGWHLLVTSEDGTQHDWRIHGVAFDFATSDGMRSLLEWAREGAAVRREVELSRDIDADGEPYAPDDPKHPHYRELMAEAADQARKEARES